MRPIMMDLQGLVLTAEEREMLTHPLVGGVILFSRNFESTEQLSTLVRAIRETQQWPLLIAVDQEGGRVQRFKDGFTKLPPLKPLGVLYEKDPEHAKKLAHDCGWVMASEILAMGVDISFAPVADVDRGESNVLRGGRSFGASPAVVATLATHYVEGMRAAGMRATAKHFPGHGAVQVDSHVGLPVDERSFKTIWEEDILPFKVLIEQGIAAVMSSHVIYAAVDEIPAGFSELWLQVILRQLLRFDGVIFTDDLSMMGASVIPDVVERVRQAIVAGSDMALVCNDHQALTAVLEGLDYNTLPPSKDRLSALLSQHHLSMNDLQQRKDWQTRTDEIQMLLDYEQSH